MVDHPRGPSVIHTYPTLLQVPCRVTGWHQAHILPGLPADYSVTELPKGFFTVRSSCGKWIYFGEGPIEVVRSPAPF